jgi:RNA 2',3'-cyclic 3'-phosphodiesterase
MAHPRHTPAAAGAQMSLLGTTAPMQVQRLFLGLFPDEAARRRIGEVVDGLTPGLSPGIKTIAPDRWHLTLHFLGDHDGVREDIERGAIQACESVRAASVDVRLDRLGSFKGKRPIAVLRNSQTPAGLQALWEALRKPLAMARFGPWIESTFEPHVTLYYGDTDLELRPVEPIAWGATDFRLIRSAYGQSQYHELGRWPLG